MALQYLNLADESSSTLSFVKALYESAFPIEERRAWKAVLLLLKDPDMQLDLILEDNTPIGFLTWWQVDDWLFIEHFAIADHIRGGGHGSAVMRRYLEMSKGKMLLEVEPPLTVDAERRIHFYNRLGLVVIPSEYRQPSYVEASVDYPMLLMATRFELTEAEKAVIIRAVKLKVYQV